MKTEMIQVPILNPMYKFGEDEQEYVPTDPLEAFVVVKRGLWVHKTVKDFNEVEPRGNWTISVGPKKAKILSFIPSQKMALRIARALAASRLVDWTTTTDALEWPTLLREIVKTLRTAILKETWNENIKRLEALVEQGEEVKV